MPIRRNPYVLFILLLPISAVPHFFAGSLSAWTAWLVVWYVAVPAVVSLALGFTPGEVGLRLPGGGWREFTILLTLAVAASFAGLLVPSMVAYYPRFEYHGWVGFLGNELLMGVVMFSHELFFRGFMLFPLAGESPLIAVVAQDVPYTLVHLGKPLPELPYAFAAGLIFAWLDLRGRSFLQSFLLHWGGSAFFDVLCALVKAGML